jgi:hypothetical protein
MSTRAMSPARRHAINWLRVYAREEFCHPDCEKADPESIDDDAITLLPK